jgi:hypothetical protein
MTNDLPGPIVPPVRDGRRRTFSQADKGRISSLSSQYIAPIVIRSYF